MALGAKHGMMAGDEGKNSDAVDDDDDDEEDDDDNDEDCFLLLFTYLF